MAAPNNGKSRNGEVEHMLDFKKIGAIIKKNWMVMTSDPIRLRTLMIFPLIMILVFGLTAGKTPTHIPAAIADYDNSNYSLAVQQQLYSNNLFAIDHQVGSQDEGKALIASGAIKILFIIPQGFGADIAAGKPATLSVIVDESDPSVAQITQAFTESFVQTMSQQITMQRVAQVGAESQQLNAYLALESGALQNTESNTNHSSQTDMESMINSYVDARNTQAGTDRSIATLTTALGKEVGVPVDPNSVSSVYHDNGTLVSSIYELMSASTQDQYFLGQIATYNGIQESGDRITGDAGNIYASAQNIYATTLEQTGELQEYNGVLGAAQAKASNITDSVMSIPPNAIELNVIEPYGTGRTGLDYLIPSILALIVFQGAVMGMGRAIAGERQDGSLTRVFLTPTSNTTIIAGTLSFYMIFETVRSSLIVFAAMILFGVVVKGNMLSVIFIIAIYAAGCTGLGMILSVLSKSQEQYQAMAMLASLPVMFLAGVFIPIETMPAALQSVTKILPLTYASDALRGIMIKGFTIGQVVPDIMFLVGFSILTVAISVMLFKRELI